MKEKITILGLAIGASFGILLMALLSQISFITGKELELYSIAEEIVGSVDNYIYRETPDSLEMTKEDLLQYGGDCKDWTEYYETLVPEGINTTKLLINTADSYHMILAIANDDGYCIIDGKFFRCFVFGG